MTSTQVVSKFQTIERLPVLMRALGIAKSTTHHHISLGLITKPVSCGGPRAVGWPSNEIEALVAARIAGKSEEEIKALVVSLTAARQAG